MFNSYFSRFVLAAAGTLVFCLQAVAEPDVLELRNGDLISGELLRVEDGIIYFQSQVFGEISFSEDEVEQIIVAEEVEEVPPPTPDDPAVPEIRDRWWNGWWTEWSGRFDLGLTFQSGRSDRREISVRGQAEREIERNHYRATAEYIFGRQDGETSTDNYGADFRWRRTLDDHFFFQTLTSYEVDRIRRIRDRAEQNIMIGYQYLDTERFEASVGPGFTVQYNNVEGIDDRVNYLATGFQDFIWRITEAYRFEQDSTFLIEPDDTDNFLYRFNAGIIGTLTDNINLSIRYNLTYENAPSPGVENANHRLITSIGYAF